MKEPNSPWRHGGLLFGRMFEDWTVEARVFRPTSRVFCIASAGCTALALAARGHDVTAADINRAQVALVRARLTGATSQEGAVDRILSRGRRALRWLGWTEARLREFLVLEDRREQLGFWRTHLNTWRWRTSLTAMLNPVTLRLFYPPALVRAFPDGFAKIVRGRLERGFATHPNRTNPYAWSLLLGEWVDTAPPPQKAAVTVVHADAAEYLEAGPACSFDAFTLSNILDGASTEYASRLRAAVSRAARPDAVTVIRSFAEPDTPEEDAWASRDRALLWGRIHVGTPW